MCKFCEYGAIWTETDGERVTWCEDCVEGLGLALEELSRRLCGLGETLADIDAKSRLRGLDEWERRWRAGVQATFDATVERHDLLERRWAVLAAEERAELAEVAR